MSEIYLLNFEGCKPVFSPLSDNMPKCVMEPHFNPVLPTGNLTVTARMGDPDIIACVVFKYADKAGGVFSLHDKNGLLFAAKVENNLDFTLAAGFFGELTANARYGADVFENMEEPDD